MTHIHCLDVHNWVVSCLAAGAAIVLYDGALIPPRDVLRVVFIAQQESVAHLGSGAAYLHKVQTTVNLDIGDAARGDAEVGALRQFLRTLKMVLEMSSPLTV